MRAHYVESKAVLKLGLFKLQNGDICNLEVIRFTGAHVSATTSNFLAHSRNFTALTTKYLINYVDIVWHIFTPRQSDKFVQHDNTYRNMIGTYLLLTTSAYNSDRGILVTERYNLADNGVSICFSLAVFKSSSDNILEIYQGESFNESHAIKIWDFTGKTNDWQTFDILATPFNHTSIDIFFYIVSGRYPLLLGITHDKRTIPY